MSRTPFTRFAVAAAVTLAPALAPATANADEVTDTLNSALTAYEEGDIQYALEELEFAKQLMNAMKTDALVGYLPDAPAGWTREISTEMNAGMAMLGGGVSAEATYSNGTDDITITIMADSPMAAMMGGLISNAGVMGFEIKRVGREKFVNQDGELTGLVDNRILVQASGGDIDTQLMLLELMDLKALKDFGE